MFRAWMDLLVNEESGQDLVEYALLAGLLAVVSVAGLRALGPVVAGFYQGLIPYFDV